MTNQTQNKLTPNQTDPKSIISARETQLTRSIDSEFNALVSLEETKAQLAKVQAHSIELKKQFDIRENQLENLKSEYNVVATKASAFGWFIENLSSEIPDIPNTTIDSHVTARIMTEFQNHKTGEKHLANMSLVNFAYGIHEAPAEPDTPEIPETDVEEVHDQETELSHGLGKKPVAETEKFTPESKPTSRLKNSETVNLKKRRK